MQQLGKKLQLKQDQQVLLLNAPESVARILNEEGYRISTTTQAGDTCKFDAVQLFVHDKAELEKFAQAAAESLNPTGLFWIAYPKKSSGVVSDLTRDEGWKIIAEMGYSGVRQVAIDNTWSSLRFKHQSERTEPSKFGADYPGIDKVNRTVTPPEDLQAALDAAGLDAKFQTLSFTCKKEYVLAVLDARRAETRANRIMKTIEHVAEN